MKKNDLILIGAILLVAVSFIFINKFFLQKPGNQVEVMVDGELYITLPLNVDTEMEIKGVLDSSNYLIIEDGYAKVVEATCPDKLCIDQKKIKYRGETIVCLPNKVIVQVVGEEEASIDAVAN